ncbi:MAG: hypothetical protein DRP56_01270 [Planctomycetota bacterium]|nr:MAG: hypothetical protein DRP56_01270 [Planctomycetota bacterium]
METLRKIWKVIEHHRYTVVAPVVGGLIWLAAVGCTPLTVSPLDEAKRVNASQLSIEFKSWEARQTIVAAKFEAAGEDLTRQAEANEAFKQTLLTLASGSVADWSGLVQLLVGGGLLGVIGDNVRKNGVIGGLKRNKT